MNALQGKTEISQISSDFDESPIIEISKLKREDGTPMLAHAARLFEQLIIKSTRDLAEAVQLNDLERINFTAHKLKSACANLGLISLAGLCRKLEQLNGDSDSCSAQKLLDQFNVEFVPANKWLQGRINAHS